MIPGTRTVTVLCVGLATLDHVFPIDVPLRPGHKHPGTGHTTTGGGPAANAAVTVSRLGGRAVLAGRIGDDHAGDLVRTGLGTEHVDTRLLTRCPGATTPTSAVIVGPDGERTIVNHTADDLFGDGSPGFGDLRPDSVLVDGRWPAGSVAALRMARRLGVCGVVDIDRTPARGELTAILDLASHVVFGADALAELAGTPDPTEALHRVHTRAVVAVTSGARGVWWRDGGENRRENGDEGAVRWIPAVPVVAVDTTAAGDVFHGALALALAEHAHTEAALRFAAAAAAVKCTRRGGRPGIPVRPEVEELLGEERRGDTQTVGRLGGGD